MSRQLNHKCRMLRRDPYVCDAAGRVGSISRADNAIQYGYDAFLQTSEQTLAGTISREYNNDFRLTTLTLNASFGVSYSYDDDGLLIQAGDISLIRDPASGFLTGTVLGNVTDQRSYNGFGEVSQYTANVSGDPVYTVTYSYDTLGRITNQAETIGGSTIIKAYTYDLRGRLSSVAALGEGGSYTNTYTYDPNGNRLQAEVGGALRAATFDSQDRQLACGDLTFAYSANGTQTNRTANGQSTTLSYDLFGQLSSVSLPDGRRIGYDRDALGRITAKRVNGIITKGWIYKDGLKPIAETDASGNVVSYFVYGSSPLTPDYMTRDGNTYRLIRDHVGSVRLVVDANSDAIAQRIDYDSFGNVLSDTNPGFQPFGFQSGLYDSDTGFVQFGARWYDPLTGRWLSKDSLLLAAGWNVYAFCGNNPVMFIDPSGLAFNDWMQGNVWASAGWGASEGAAAALDGVIPFVDPFSIAYRDESGNYADGTKISQNLGAFSRDIYIGARIPNLTKWLTNPRLYEIGSRTVPNRVWSQIQNLDVVDRGRWLLQNAESYELSEMLLAYRATWNTGLTPGGRLFALGLGSFTDYLYRSK